MEEKSVLKREEIRKEDTWALEDLYESDDIWTKEYKEVKSLSEAAQSYRNTLGNSPEALEKFLKYYENISKRTERLYVYANQKYHQDTGNTVYQSFADMAENIMSLISEKISFAVPEILEIEEKQLREWMEKEDGLKKYSRFLNEIIRKKPHSLSAEMEELLAQAGEMSQSPEDIFMMFNNADLKFPEIKDKDGKEMELSHSRYMLFLQDQDRTVRKAAFDALYHTYQGFQNTLAASYKANVKQEIFFAKARKYTSTLEMELDDSEIPVIVYDNLIKTVDKNLPKLHRYMELRKRIMGVDKLHMYDLYVPLVSDFDMDISFEEAKKIAVEGLKPLGEEYQNILCKGFRERWIDVYENRGKRSGAYSWGAYGTHPYVLLNYKNNLNNVFTLVHEMGHAIHSYYSDSNQEYLDAGYKIFVAEVASTCNEALLMQDLLSKTEDKKKKAYLINYFLEQFRTTLYRQAMFAEFEKITHKMAEDGEALTAGTLNRIYYELNIKYFGEAVEIDKEIEVEWARIPHFYNSFYVYQYATGYSAAIALAQKILTEGNTAVENYKEFLKGGCSKSPIELLKAAGVDMTTSEPVEKALQLFDTLLDQMETIIK